MLNILGVNLMARKYCLTGKSRVFKNTTIYQIRALRDIPEYGVEKGDLGGWVEVEDTPEQVGNLAQEGDCWLFEDAIACGHARVSENARARDGAVVEGFAQVSGNAKIFGTSNIQDRAIVDGFARVYHASVCNCAHVGGEAFVHHRAQITDWAEISGKAEVREYAKISGHAKVYGDARVFNKAEIFGTTAVFGNARVYGDVKLSASTDICMNMRVCND